MRIQFETRQSANAFGDSCPSTKILSTRWVHTYHGLVYVLQVNRAKCILVQLFILIIPGALEPAVGSRASLSPRSVPFTISCAYHYSDNCSSSLVPCTVSALPRLFYAALTIYKLFCPAFIAGTHCILRFILPYVHFAALP